MEQVEAEEVALEELLNSPEGKDLRKTLDEFISQLRRRHFKSSFVLTQETLHLIRLFVGRKRWTSVKYLMGVIRAVGRRLLRTRPNELVIGNAVRRVLFMIREEYAILLRSREGAGPPGLERGSDSSVQVPLLGQSASRDDIGLHSILSNEKENKSEIEEVKFADLRSKVIDVIMELLVELETQYEGISDQALEHIHANEIVLVFGESKSVEVFLEAAKRKRSFEVVVAEAAPGFTGHEMAKRLSAKGIPTTVITDSAIQAMMARVNKVLIGTHAVLANGGLLTTSGVHMVALSARHHRVPVVCVTGLYKLSPVYAHNVDTFNDLLSPGSVMAYGDIPSSENVQIISPSIDYVPPELVNLFITNSGGHQPSYVYRLLAEYYHPEDILLEDQQ